MGFKMVRDLHQERLAGVISGTWRISPDPVSALVKKLGEEYSEFCEDRDPAELYDIADVLDELIRLLDPDRKYQDEHLRKVRIVGLFTTHLEWNPLPQGDVSWPQYMDSNDSVDR